MLIEPANLINIVLAFAALYFYIIGSRRFYQQKNPFIYLFVIAIVLDATTAILASFGITPTTQLPNSDFVPWQSTLFLIHIILASFGFFGFIIMILYVLIKGKESPYPRLSVFQYKVLLPAWLVGEGIALVTSVVKLLFRVRIYDYL